MKERPILFSAPMVCAILEGRKTQTRRVVKPQPNRGSELTRMQDGYADGFIRAVFAQDDEPNAYGIRCPYGERGDRLWVRETWGLRYHNNPRDWFSGGIRGFSEKAIRAIFTVEHRESWATNPKMDYCRPSIHMPRWASRITLEITAVRVERLQDISEEDAMKEGVVPFAASRHTPANFRDGFTVLWQSIYGTGSWDANPWVWVLEFRKVEDVK